ncbi:MAG: hypothetical protein JO257_24515 [Deltaproteobacteria bacterium]|nr:hypothetical protein [Deltaproteobacteria bacterium]
MRAAIAVLLVTTGTSYADRIPVITLGGTIDFRFTSPTWDAAEKKQTPDAFGGAQLTLSFEDAPLPLTQWGHVAGEARLVPELIVGELGNDQYAEGYVGAGLRGEIHMAGPKARAGFYTAARGLIIGAHRDSAAEFVIGDYILLKSMTRIGVEGGAMVRPQDRDGNHELDATMRVYVGWRL